ncbi:MAG: adenylate/guanylate cyclase domain-containing protein [Gammaproteobacteria bacterium]
MHKLVAVMYTDMVGYTALMARGEGSARQLNELHTRAVRELVEKFSGHVYEVVGDGTLSYFTSASDCVRCAVALQQSFAGEPKVPVRIGIHIGEIRDDGDLVYGSPLNIASRIESLGVAGSILVSGHVIDSMSGKAGLQFVPMGSFAFKNVDKPIEIHAVAGQGLRVPDPDSVSGKLKVLERKDIVLFEEWDDRELINRLSRASVLCQQAVCSYGFINYNYSKLRAFVRGGGRFECVMIHPRSAALQVSPERQTGATADVEYARGQLQLAFHKLKGLASDRIVFKLTHHLPDPIMTFIDPATDDGVLFITLTGFRMDLHERPSCVLRRSTHARWFEFYYQSFRKLQESERTIDVDLNGAWEDVLA